jgi:hypothetical protein
MPNNGFFRRPDVTARLELALLPGKDPAETQEAAKDLKTFALCGIGGLGKTELASQFMFTHERKFNAVFWLQADEPTKLREGFSQAAVNLGLEDPGETKDQAVSADLVKAWLAKPIKNPDLSEDDPENMAKWLLILDNADNLEYLNDYWPRFGKGSILITSRNPQAKQSLYLSSSGGIDLQPFTLEEGALFLLELTQTEAESESPVRQDALAVSQRLGGHALGLKQMSGVINRKGYTLGEFLTKYDEQSLSRFHQLSPGLQPENYKYTVATVFALDNLEPRFYALLEVISLLDPDGIKEDILIKGASHVNIEAYPKDEDAYEDNRAELYTRSLTTRNQDQRELRVHRLTQDAVRGRMSPDRFRLVFVNTVSLLSASWPYVGTAARHNTDRWAICEALVPHVLRLHSLYLSSTQSNKLAIAEKNLGRLFVDASWYVRPKSSCCN